MRRRRRRTLTVLLLCAAVLAGAVLSTRWVLYRFYPLDHRAEVFRHAAVSGLDPYLVAALIRVESGWDPGAVSAKGAVGLMQLMPATALWAAERMGLGDYSPDRLAEPGLNIRIGTWYLAYLRGRFDGNLLLALAAYNGGDSNVRQWVAQNRWAGDPHRIDQIPFPETRSFLGRVIRDYRVYRRLYAPTGELQLPEPGW